MSDFDEKAKTWDADPVKTARAHAVAEAIKTSLPLRHPLTALEYGCGTGLLSFALQPHLGRITLADSSPGMLETLDGKIASSGIGNMNSLKLDLATDPPPPAKYQLIYTLMTLHHIQDTEQILRAFHTLLEQPGFLCIADLDKEDGSFHGPGFSGHNGFDRAFLQQQAQAVGFRAITFSTVFQMVRGDGLSKKEYPLFLMVAQKG